MYVNPQGSIIVVAVGASFEPTIQMKTKPSFSIICFISFPF
jgi:hypothetical protein